MAENFLSHTNASAMFINTLLKETADSGYSTGSVSSLNAMPAWINSIDEMQNLQSKETVINIKKVI